MALDLVFVAKGSFVMVDTWGDGSPTDKPTHKVTLTYDFHIGKYETTFEEYDAFCSATGRSKPYDVGWGRGQRPVILVSWWDAIAYCNWLSEKEKLPKAYDSNGNLLDKDGRVTTDPSKVVGYRLPTEAEWEYAARGGNKSKGYKYSGSDNVDDVAWYTSNAGSKTQEVGKKAPNELDLYDMSGNVWEWCSDWYGSYSSSAQTNPYNNSGSDRVLRGGDWNDNATGVRVALRYYVSPTSTRVTWGFRICRTVPYEGENRPPLSPYNPSPSDEAIVGATTVTLRWASYDPDGDTMTYDVYLDTNATPTTKVSSNQTENTLIRSNLSYDTTYYWKVVVKDSKGATTEGPVWRFTTLTVPEGMVLVEKGSFTMGDTWGDGKSDEKTTHKVTFTYNFYMGKYETTFDEYDAFCEATGRSKPGDEGWGRGTRPVIKVRWNDAIGYCNWLSEKEDLPKAYDSKGNLLDKDGNITTDPSMVMGYRLPTEAEWEYAARGGNKSKGYKYSGSDNVDEVACHWRNSGDMYLTGEWNWGTLLNNNCKTQEVGKKAPNELGLYDMSGNVYEWCSDRYRNYSSRAQTNPYNSTVSSYGSGRVARGGSWVYLATNTRVANRLDSQPDVAYYGLGFRICRTVPGEGENRPSLTPYKPKPSDKATNQPLTVALSWNCSNPDGDALTYDVYLDTNRKPTTKISTSQSGKTLSKGNLSTGTTYYWKVVAKDSKGATTEGPVWRFTTLTVPEGMVLVEKGSFTMGDTWGDGSPTDKPTHKVTLTYDFHIGKYETTFEEYDAFCSATGRSKPYDVGWGRGQRPVILVSWWDAIAYCNRLSEKEDLPKAYDDKGNLLDKNGNITTDPSKVEGYRLPTEAEWEYAARGGTKSKGYKYSGSDNVDDVAWYWDNSGRKTQEVGKKASNELGIYDMSGNVYEWCSDWYGSYSSSVQTNPYNSTAGSGRVIRGGSWNYFAAEARVAYRALSSPTFTGNVLGFRICRTVPYEGGNRPPLAPYNPSLSNEVVVWTTSVTLRWDSYDPDGDTMTYDVYFDTNATPTTKVSSNQTENTLNRSNLSYDTTYYWKVVAKDSKGATTEGPLWRFSTRDIDVLPYKLARTLPSTVLVEKGSFTMGDPDGGSDEKPTHKVTFTYNFHIGKYEVTFDEYDAFCEATGRSKPEDEGWGRGKKPVINASWNDAIAYCNWLSDKEKLPKAYDDEGNFLDKDGGVTTDPSKVAGYRLPTEAEWEYAARGGSKSKGYKYAGSNNPDEVAWYGKNSGDKYLTGEYDWRRVDKNNCRTHQVGTKVPNELGLYDMSGNVREWCSDRYGDYSSSAQTNPYNSVQQKRVLSSYSYRVYRGGGCYSDAAVSRVAYRNYFSPASTSFDLGFRICRTVPYEGENRPPLSPYNPSPSDEAIVGATTVTLRWDSYDPDGDLITYDVYLDINVNPTTKASSNQTENTLIRSNLSYDTTYYWKVVVKDSKGATTEGPVWRFIIQELPLPQMVLVEKDRFTMGDAWDDWVESEYPTHKVTFTYDFYMGKYETTFDEYDAFCSATGRSKPYDKGWGRGQRPVMNVSWWDAVAYCNWLSEKEDLPKAYDSNGNLLDKGGRVTTDPSKVVGFRLPTEAEWEYAARGRNKSKGYKYAGSDNVDDVAWYDSNSGGKTQEVGKKAPNELGIYDMSGNVYEWCSDWWYHYTETPKTNPYNSTVSSYGSGRVLRGGSWFNDAAYVRVAYRDFNLPTYTRSYLGFRISRTAY